MVAVSAVQTLFPGVSCRQSSGRASERASKPAQEKKKEDKKKDKKACSAICHHRASLSLLLCVCSLPCQPTHSTHIHEAGGRFSSSMRKITNTFFFFFVEKLSRKNKTHTHTKTEMKRNPNYLLHLIRFLGLTFRNPCHNGAQNE